MFALRRFLLLTLLSLSLAVHAKETFQIEHLPQLKSAGNLTLSPNGETVAYTVSAPRDILAGDKDGRADTHLYIIKGKGAPTLFIGGEGSISSLQFNANGDTLYFKSKRGDDEHTALYSISMNGGEPQKVYSYETALGDYAVSNDGNALYFVAGAKDDNKKLKDKGFNAYVFEEKDSLNQLWRVALDNDDAKPESIFSSGHVSNFVLSDNGKTIVAAVAPTHLIDDYYMKRDLVVMDSATGEVSQTIDMPGKLGGFHLSANGKKLAINAATDIHDTSDGVLMVADVKSGKLTQLTQDAKQHIVDVDWYGNDILAVAHRGVESALVVYETDGDVDKTYSISKDLVIRSAATADGEIRFIADSAKFPNEVFAVSRNKDKKLTNHNAFLAELDLAKQSTFTYTARDGETVEGLLITPGGDMPEGGWPLILTVHGGPEAHFSDGWLTRYSNAGQFGAAQGYAVFYPNYRGSTGRGVAYAKQHQNDYAGKEFNDLVDGVKALAEAGVINKDRVGITGGSYGGYASMWGATALTEHFKAAVAFVGISNQVSKFGTSDIPNEMYLVHSLKWPWDGDNWMNLLQRSPVYHTGDAKTPILILHGAKDTRVHPGQSMELYRFLKVRTETPVRLVFYPNEGHGNRNAAAQYDYALRLMRWMNTYLAEDATRTTEMPAFDLGLEEKLKKDD